MPLFQKSVVKKYLTDLDNDKLQIAWELFQNHFQNPIIQQNIENAKEEGKLKSEPILSKGKIDTENIINLDSERFDRAVNTVVERIVKNNGNS